MELSGRGTETNEGQKNQEVSKRSIIQVPLQSKESAPDLQLD